MKKIVTGILMLMMAAGQVWGDSWLNYAPNSSEGSKFFVTFIHNGAQATTQSLHLHLFIAARQTTNVTFHSHASGHDTTITVNGSATWTHPNATDVYLDFSDATTSKSVEVTANHDIALYMGNNNDNVGDASLVIPVERLGEEYIIQSTDVNNQVTEFAVIATENNTQVQITPSVNISQSGQSSRPANQQYTVNLQKGQVYYGTSTTSAFDVSGTKICSNKKVVVYNGSQSAYVTLAGSSRGLTSHICHQSIPLDLWGKKYVVVKMQNQSNTAFKVTAAQNGTVVKVNGTQVANLNAYQSYYYISSTNSDAVYVETSKPTICYQYMSGVNTENAGTPSMALSSSLEQAVKSIKFTAFNFNSTPLPIYVNIVVPTSVVSSMMLDSVPISSQFSAVPSLSGYSYARVSITNTIHELTNAQGAFIATVYGLDNSDKSYAYNPGLNCMRLDAHLEIDGDWTNIAKKCKNSSNQWSYDFGGVVNTDYDSIVWYYDHNGRSVRMGRGDSLHYTFNYTDSLVHNVYMVVYRTTSVCNQSVADTIMAQVNNAVIYNYNLAVEYHCLENHETFTAFTGTTSQVTINVDTVPVNSVREIVKRFPTVDGCDSIVHFRYYVSDPADKTTIARTCQGTPYVYTYGGQSHSLTATGTYTYTEYDAYGCSYTRTINLTVDPTYSEDVYDTICDDETPYEWTPKQGHTFRFNTSKDTVVHFQTVHNCDSAVHLHLIVGQSHLILTKDSVCDNRLPYTWRGKTYNKTGVYYDSLKTRHRCDSVYKLDLKVLPTYYDADTATICDNKTYRWHNKVLTVAGLYWDSLKTRSGCDSVFSLLLNVNQSYHYPNTMATCQGVPVTWRGKTISATESGTFPYYDSLKSIKGCDSVYELTLTVHPAYKQEVQRNICKGQTYEFNGDASHTWKNNEVGHHRDTVRHKTSFGCDSVLILDLTVNPVYNYDTVGVTCAGTPYRWRQGDMDSTIQTTTEGVRDFYSNHRTSAGCDSNYHLRLTVNNTILIQRTVSISDQDSAHWDGMVYAGPKYNKTTPDSVIYTLNTPITIDHHYQTASTGCDSVMRLIITVYPTYEYYDTATTCQYEAYPIPGHSNWTWRKDVVGIHDTLYTYQSSHQCDSLRWLHLTVYPIYHNYDTMRTCSNKDFTWAGHKHIGYNTPGQYDYTDPHKTVDDCDSNFYLHLIVQDTIVNPTVQTICDVDTFRWDGKAYGGNKSTGADTVLMPGIYRYSHTYLSSSRCDSFVTLTLTVHPTYEFWDTTMVTCMHDNYQFQRQTWSWKKDTVGVFDTTYTYTSVHGCDSVWHIRVRVNPIYFIQETASTCSNEPYTWTGHKDKSGNVRVFSNLSPGPHVFYDSLKTANGCNCDSIYKLTISVVDTLLNHTDTAICDNQTLVWDTITFYGDKSAATGTRLVTASTTPYTFRHSYQSSIGCDSFVTLRLTVHPTYEFYDTTMKTCLHDDYQFQGQTWSWKKDTVGVFDTTYTYQSIHGCDSVWHIRVRVNPIYFITERASTCANVPYVWTGHKDGQGNDIVFANLGAGVHVLYDSLKTANGCNCDSIHQLTLTVVDTIVMYTRRTICDDDTVHWQGRLFRGDKWQGTGGTVLNDSTHPYVFDLTFTSVLTGCDSIERLVIWVHPTHYTILDDASICQYETFRFGVHDIACNHPGTFTYIDSLQNIYGCDSVIEITLRVDSAYRFDTYMTICDNTTWTWREHTYSNLPAGQYSETDHLLTIHECDSDYVLHLTVVSSYLFTDRYEICDYDTMVWRTRTYGPLKADSHVFWDSLATIACGCDSVYKLELIVHSSYFIHDTLSMCDNETIQVRWHSIHGAAGKYHFVDTLASMYNCDSVIDLTVYIHPTYLFVDSTTICSNQTYQWRGGTYRTAGTYWDSLETQKYGCDSVYKLVLTVTPAYLFESYRTICDNESIVFQGQTLRDDGDHHFKYYTVNGCDSEYVMHLTVNPTYWIEHHVTICDNETYTFAGRTLRNSGVYYDSIPSHKGCDSVNILYLTVRPTYHFTDNHIMCSNETFLWRNNYYNQTGVYYDSLKTEYNCDSIYELRLTVNPAYNTVIDTVICDYQKFWFNGKRYSQTGTYYDTMGTVLGCDSVFIVNLTVIETITEEIYDTICVGDTYTFGSMQLTTSGTYRDTICMPLVDDCRFRILYLDVFDSTIITAAGIPDICADDPSFFVDYKWKGKEPATYSILFDEAAKEEGFVDIIDAPFTDNKSIEVPVPPCVIDSTYTTFLKNNSYASYVRPDHYTVTLQLNNGACDPKQNEVKSDLFVKYPSWIIEQNWEDVISLLNKYYNGGYVFSSYYWVVNSTKHFEETGSYIYWPGKLQIGDNVHIMLQRVNDTSYIPSCDITVISHSIDSTGDLPFYTFSPEPHGALMYGGVRIKSLIDGDYIITDATGKRIMVGHIKKEETQDLDLKVPSGIYFIYFYVPDGRSTVKKILINNK